MNERTHLRDELYRLERALAARDPAGLDRELADLIADDFVEFGASGRSRDAATTRDLVATAPWVEGLVLDDFEAAEVAPDVVLVTYRLGPPRPSTRSSIWLRRDGRWRIRFHQGTLRSA